MRSLNVLREFNPVAEPATRRIWVYLRAFYLVRIRRRLRTISSPHAVDTTVSHNLRSLMSANSRINLLMLPMSTIETLDKNTSRLLVIGPLNEHDLYTLVGLGFRRANIVGLDLISYSDFIKLGDMHDIPFPESSFDAVVCGWTISYSNQPEKVADEIVRVTRSGGVVAIGVEYSTMTKDDEKALVGYSIQETETRRVNSTREILDLFGGRVDTVFFAHDAPRKISHGKGGLKSDVSNVAVAFSMRK